MPNDSHYFSLETKLQNSWPAIQWKNRRTVVAVSGGADSVALLRAIVRLATQIDCLRDLVVAHFDHQLREESTGDAIWVQNLCEQLGVSCVVGTGKVQAEADKQGDGIEAAARISRLQFFQKVASKEGARFVATAHTASDQAETVLFRTLRGTGIRGLAGIPRSRLLTPSITLIRPMLDITRQEVCEYLEQLNQPWREDKTNAELHFSRNRIRNELLPTICQHFNPRVEEALLRLSRQASELNQWAEAQATKWIEAHVHFCSSDTTEQNQLSVTIDKRELAATAKVFQGFVLREVWRKAGWPEQAMSETHWKALISMVSSDVAASKTSQDACSQSFPGNVQAVRSESSFVLHRT